MHRLTVCSRLVLLIGLLAGLLLADASVASAQGFRGGRGGRGGRGPDQEFVRDRNTFHFLLANHAQIRRQVKRLPNGVETLTESDNPQVAMKIVEHVQAMYDRVDEGRPIRMRDPLFRAIFRQANQVKMEVEPTGKGVRVRETSDDAFVVKLIQAHADVVSAFVAKGFEEARRNHPVPAAGGRGALNEQELAKAKECLQLFADFDQHFIPALALTKQAQSQPAKQAVERFEAVWRKELAARGDQAFAEHDAWPATREAIAAAILRCQRQVQAGELAEAHETLEPIRNLLTEFRTANQIVYSLDPLARFHDTMEEIVKPATMMQSSEVDDAYRQQLQELVKRAEEQWQAVMETDFEQAFVAFERDAKQAFDFGRAVAEENAAIEDLQQALAGDDNDQLLLAARKLKPAFAKCYMFFGDFRNANHEGMKIKRGPAADK